MTVVEKEREKGGGRREGRGGAPYLEGTDYPSSLHALSTSEVRREMRQIEDQEWTDMS